MLNCYPNQRAGKTNKGHRVAAKKIVSFVLAIFLAPMAILSYFNRQNPGYL